MSELPLQPIYTDKNGTLRFKENAIVQYLLESSSSDLNQLALMNFNNADWTQFASLIGYSLGGFADLSYVSDEVYGAAEQMSKGVSELDARNAVLREQLDGIRKGLKISVSHAFKTHPGDLEV